tara:strand:- start:87494 stop:88690 length:1197 start_codon:yes stop_codon:yes gene_type:complete
MNRVALITAKVPPARDGIGDYASRLAEGFVACGKEVLLLTSLNEELPTQIDGVITESPFKLDRRDGVWGLVAAMESLDIKGQLPDAIILQFNQFSWGNWGLNLALPNVMLAIKQRWPSVQLGVMFHEKAVPPTNFKFRVMRLWQTRQYRALANVADVRFFSIQRWADEEALRSPHKPAIHLPVGSNLSRVSDSRDAIRTRLLISPDDIVLGVFGGTHASRLVGHIAAAVRSASQHNVKTKVLVVGSAGPALRTMLTEVSCNVDLIDLGYQPTKLASEAVAAMDVMLAPFTDGLSTRRGSAIAALQQGVALLSTDGSLTDDLLRNHNGRSFVLTPVRSIDAYAMAAVQMVDDNQRRNQIAKSGAVLYRQCFDWKVITKRIIDQLTMLPVVKKPSQDILA